MLKAIAYENVLTGTPPQHIKGVLSGIFTHAKNEGAFDGGNPVRDVHIPGNAREPGEACANNLNEIVEFWILCLCYPKQSLRRRRMPVFVKANCGGSARGDEEDGDELGRLCTNCAPN